MVITFLHGEEEVEDASITEDRITEMVVEVAHSNNNAAMCHNTVGHMEHAPIQVGFVNILLLVITTMQLLKTNLGLHLLMLKKYLTPWV